MRLGENLELILRNKDTNKVLETWNLAEIIEERTLAVGTYFYNPKAVCWAARLLMTVIGETVVAKLKRYRIFNKEAKNYYWEQRGLGR